MSSSSVLGKGRTALVTGASRGIGTLIAGELAAFGGHVVLTGRSAADLEAVTAQPGQVTGQGVQDFFVVTPGIAPITGSPAPTGTIPASPSGSGYGY